MGIDALKAAVESEGRERASRIRREAEQQAAGLRADAAAELDRRVSRALHGEEPKLSREFGGRLAAVRREARGRVLGQRDALLDRVFEAAQRALPRDLEAPGARSAFEARLERALGELPDAAVVRCPPALAEAARQAVARHAAVRVEEDPELAGGFRALAEHGRLEVDATLETLLALHRPRLSIEVLRRLDAVAKGRPA